MNEDVLRELFEAQGTVVASAVPRDSATGMARGFGFITFPDEQTALAARHAMDGHIVDDRPLLVRLKGEPTNAPSMGGRRGARADFELGGNLGGVGGESWSTRFRGTPENL